MESNHPTGGLLRPAGFEDRMGHQTPAAPPAMLGPRRLLAARLQEGREEEYDDERGSEAAEHDAHAHFQREVTDPGDETDDGAYRARQDADES